MTNGQKSNRLDSITKSKIWKSFKLVLLGIGTYAAFSILDWLLTIDIGNEFIRATISFLVPFLKNAISEYKDGE